MNRLLRMRKKKHLETENAQQNCCRTEAIDEPQGR
jgi:hypothetical protein